MNLFETEQNIRSFLAEELMKQKALTVERDALLDLDSLEVTELRVFLSDEIGIKFDAVSQINLDTIENILAYVDQSVTAQESEVANATAR